MTKIDFLRNFLRLKNSNMEYSNNIRLLKNNNFYLLTIIVVLIA